MNIISEIRDRDITIQISIPKHDVDFANTIMGIALDASLSKNNHLATLMNRTLAPLIDQDSAVFIAAIKTVLSTMRRELQCEKEGVEYIPTDHEFRTFVMG